MLKHNISCILGQTSLILAGGVGEENLPTKVELISHHEFNCNITNLPKGMAQNPSMFQHGMDIIICGGLNNERECFKLEKGTWTHFNQLIRRRRYAMTVSMQHGTIVFGGYDSPSTTEILKHNQSSWLLDENMENSLLHVNTCGIQISQDELVIIGGYDNLDYNHFQTKRIVKVNITSSEWLLSELSLSVGRYEHSCVYFDSKIIITGGFNEYNDVTSSTEIIDIDSNGSLMSPREAGNLNIERYDHGMGIVNLEQGPTVIAFGGIYYNGIYRHLDSVEIWDAQTETWNISSNLILSEPKSGFGYAMVPTELICP